MTLDWRRFYTLVSRLFHLEIDNVDQWNDRSAALDHLKSALEDETFQSINDNHSNSNDPIQFQACQSNIRTALLHWINDKEENVIFYFEQAQGNAKQAFQSFTDNNNEANKDIRMIGRSSYWQKVMFLIKIRLLCIFIIHNYFNYDLFYEFLYDVDDNVHRSNAYGIEDDSASGGSSIFTMNERGIDSYCQLRDVIKEHSEQVIHEFFVKVQVCQHILNQEFSSSHTITADGNNNLPSPPPSNGINHHLLTSLGPSSSSSPHKSRSKWNPSHWFETIDQRVYHYQLLSMITELKGIIEQALVLPLFEAQRNAVEGDRRRRVSGSGGMRQGGGFGGGNALHRKLNVNLVIKDAEGSPCDLSSIKPLVLAFKGDITAMAIDPIKHRIAIATTHGRIYLLDSRTFVRKRKLILPVPLTHIESHNRHRHTSNNDDERRIEYPKIKQLYIKNDFLFGLNEEGTLRIWDINKYSSCNEFAIEVPYLVYRFTVCCATSKGTTIHPSHIKVDTTDNDNGEELATTTSPHTNKKRPLYVFDNSRDCIVYCVVKEEDVSVDATNGQPVVQPVVQPTTIEGPQINTHNTVVKNVKMIAWRLTSQSKISESLLATQQQPPPPVPSTGTEDSDFAFLLKSCQHQYGRERLSDIMDKVSLELIGDDYLVLGGGKRHGGRLYLFDCHNPDIVLRAIIQTSPQVPSIPPATAATSASSVVVVTSIYYDGQDALYVVDSMNVLKRFSFKALIQTTSSAMVAVDSEGILAPLPLAIYEDKQYPIHSISTGGLYSNNHTLYHCYYDIVSLYTLSLREKGSRSSVGITGSLDSSSLCKPYKVNHIAELERLRRLANPRPATNVGGRPPPQPGILGFFQFITSIFTYRPTPALPPLPPPCIVIASEGKVYSYLHDKFVVYMT